MKNFLFDLDGTIGNTLPLCIEAFRAAIEPLSGTALSEADILATFGPSEEGTIAALLPNQQEEGMRSFLDHYERMHPQWPDPFDGMLEVLNYLKSKHCFVGLITGKAAPSTDVTLKYYGLGDFFDVVKTGAPTGPVKDIRIEEALKEYGLAREQTLYVGDSPKDIAASRKCRIQVAAAAWAPTAEIEELKAGEPDRLFTSIAQFFEFTKMLCGD